MQGKEWTALFYLIQAAVWKAEASPLGSKGNIPEFSPNIRERVPYFAHVITSSALTGKGKPMPWMLRVRKFRKKLTPFKMLHYHYLGMPVLYL